MNYGHLCRKKPTNAGSGSLCVARHGKSLPTSSATAARRLVKNCRSVSRRPIAPDTVTPTLGKPIKKFSRPNNTPRVAKRQGKRITSNGGTTRYANIWPALSVRPYRFPNPRRCTKIVCAYFFIATISRYVPLDLSTTHRRLCPSGRLGLNPQSFRVCTEIKVVGKLL